LLKGWLGKEGSSFDKMAFNQILLSYQKFLKDLLFICHSAKTKKKGWKKNDNPPYARKRPKARPATTTITVVKEGKAGVKTKQNKTKTKTV
jgi:hypothetical protein